MDTFNLIMISAWHEQFGNGMLRMLDGHPNLYVYPFESQVSTTLSSNIISGPNHWVPQRYSYPEFSSEITPEAAYHAIWDQELKTYLRTPHLSKFKNCGLVMNESKRIESFLKILGQNKRISRALLIEAFFRSTFMAWENYPASGNHSHYVGYSPPIIFDADKFFNDFPNGHMIHVIRNPFSGFADTIKRPFPFSLTKYCQIWNMTQVTALVYQKKYANKVHLVFAEHIFNNPEDSMKKLLMNLEVPWHNSVLEPSFSGQKLEQIYPWGTIRYPTSVANSSTAAELTVQQKEDIRTECWPVLNLLNYDKHFNL